MRVTVIDPARKTETEQTLTRRAGGYALEMARGPAQSEALYLGPPWIDSHVHVFDGINFGLSPDAIGWRAGVHLLVDAGSAGAETLAAFLRYVVRPARTRVLAFLNVSAIGLVTMQEYHDLRQVDAGRAAQAIRAHPEALQGVKVRSSGYVVEDKGLMPLCRAVRAAELAGCPVMVHMGEAPPENAENLTLLRRGDILTHCFHGKRPPKWNAQPLWRLDGTPIPAMREALERGVLLDVGHGEASFSAAVAQPVIARGEWPFTISTDLHGRSLHAPVHSLAVTMSKFLALGMDLYGVLAAVTSLPARRLGLSGWCSDPARNGTLFRVRAAGEADPPFVDAEGEHIAVQRVIEPVAVIMDGEWLSLGKEAPG